MTPPLQTFEKAPALRAAPRTRVSAALLFPWLMAALMFGLIALDWTRAPDGPGQNASVTALDPACGMEVRSANAARAVHQGRTFHFCSTACRDLFAQEPGRYLAAPASGDTHTMRGIPTRFYQWGLALLLLVSFGLFELLARLFERPGGLGMSSRLDLLALPGARRLLSWPPLLFGARAVMSGLFLLIIAVGLFGSQNPAMNLAPLLTWTVWWTGLIFLILFAGKAWCTVCPWDALAGWAESLKAWGPRGNGFGLALPWPRSLRNIWPAVALFLLLTWVELGMGVTLIPRATAWIALGMLALAVASAFLFERKAFCRYGCLVGRVSGLYALFSSVELRAADPKVCASCRTADCSVGNARGDGCPTFEFPKTMTRSAYCTLCTQCLRTCPSGNIALNLRPWGADLAKASGARADEAGLALVLLSMTAFHGLTMTPAWTTLNDLLRGSLGVSYMLSFSLLMAAALAAPVALYAALAWAAARLSGIAFKKLFLEFAYAMLPIALFYHLAHNAEHFLMEGPKVLALASDPFGWGWNLFGTALRTFPPLVSLEGLWRLQVLFVLVGHLYSLWITERAARRLSPGRRGALLSQLPLLAAMVAFSALSLWLLKQPMEMRLSRL